MSKSITPNQREILAAQSTVTGRPEYLTSTNDILNVNAGITVYSKPTDLYGIQAISNDGTYKYFFFEDADTNYYVLRKLIATSVFSYVAGNGSYTTVYQSSVLGPSGSPNWQSYGLTF